MKPRELFGVAARAVGLYFVVQGIYRLLQIVDVVTPVITSGYRLEPSDRMQIGTFVFSAILLFAISAFFFKRADWLVRVAYPGDEKSNG